MVAVGCGAFFRVFVIFAIFMVFVPTVSIAHDAESIEAALFVGGGVVLIRACPTAIFVEAAIAGGVRGVLVRGLAVAVEEAHLQQEMAAVRWMLKNRVVVMGAGVGMDLRKIKGHITCVTRSASVRSWLRRVCSDQRRLGTSAAAVDLFEAGKLGSGGLGRHQSWTNAARMQLSCVPGSDGGTLALLQ